MFMIDICGTVHSAGPLHFCLEHVICVMIVVLASVH